MTQLVGYSMFLQPEEHTYPWTQSLIILIEYTSDPTSKAESFPQDLRLPHPTRKQITADISDLVSRPKRGRRTHSDSVFNISIKDIHPSDNEISTIHAYFTSMS